MVPNKNKIAKGLYTILAEKWSKNVHTSSECQWTGEENNKGSVNIVCVCLC